MAEEQIETGEVPVEAPVETPAEPSPEQVEAEGEARKYGWKAKEEFDLAPEGWVDANRFLELPSTQVKMLRDTRKQLERELRERDEKLSGIERTARTAVEAARKQERERYEAQLAELKTCLFYPSDAAADLLCVDIGARGILPKKNNKRPHTHPIP